METSGALELGWVIDKILQGDGEALVAAADVLVAAGQAASLCPGPECGSTTDDVAVVLICVIVAAAAVLVFRRGGPWSDTIQLPRMRRADEDRPAAGR